MVFLCLFVCFFVCFLQKNLSLPLNYRVLEKLKSGQLPFLWESGGGTLSLAAPHGLKESHVVLVTGLGLSSALSSVRGGQTGYLTFKMPEEKAHSTL